MHFFISLNLKKKKNYSHTDFTNLHFPATEVHAEDNSGMDQASTGADVLKF